MRWGRAAAIVAALAAVGGACNDDDDGGSSAESGGGGPECTPARDAEVGTSERTLAHDGLDRRYLLTIPEDYDGDTAAPVVINLHGFTGNGESQNESTDLPRIAGERGYIVVAPDGGPLAVPALFVPGAEGAEQFEGQPFWNMFGPGDVDFGPPNGQNLGIDSSTIGADDVSFLSALLDTLEDALCVDTDRLYATGMSNGAGMATMLGCTLGDRLAAIVPVSGVNLIGKCPGDGPVPVLAVHGDADDLALYDGNGLLGFQFGNPSVPERMAQWAERDDCDTEPVTDEPEIGLTMQRWQGCVDGVDVELWTLAGWPHEWPRAGSPDEPGVIDATDVALDFFDARTLDAR